jgi:quercetin dioxygenase-like cupin family protein
VPHRIARGDYIMVPPDTPHWYTKVEGKFVSVTLHMPMAAR